MTTQSPSDSTEPGSAIVFKKGLVPAVLFLVVSSLWVVFVSLVIYPLFDNGFVLLAVMSGAFAVIVCLAWLTLQWEGLRATDVGLSRENVIPGALPITLLWVLLNAVGAVYVLTSIGDVRFAVPEQWDSLSYFLGMLIAQLVFVGVAEEFAFRAYLQNKFVALLGGGHNRVRKAVAILLGVFLFTLWHIPQRVFVLELTSPLEIFQTLIAVMIFGLVLGLLYEYTRNVILVGILHGTFNVSPFVIVQAPMDLVFFVGLPVALVILWYYRRWATEARPLDFRPQVQTKSDL